MSTYSSFFSSGLLAPRTPPRARSYTTDSDLSDSWDDSSDCFSPSRPSSPLPLPDDQATPTPMQMDVDDNVSGVLKVEEDSRRSVTPTPQSQQATPVASPTSRGGRALSRERQSRSHRRRRSSLTQGTSPMHAIRSPTRAAGVAFNFQIHLPGLMRAKSGSLRGHEATASFGGVVGRVATDETSLVGRLRSGSCSNILQQAPSKLAAFRTRRVGRRIISMAIPAAVPPPTLPLPALPLISPLEASTNHNIWSPILNSGASHEVFPSNVNKAIKGPQLSSARARGLSVSKSALDGDHNKIDEEMKEN